MSLPSRCLENLNHYQSNWQHQPTKTIRVPIAIAEEVLEFARKKDANITCDSDAQLRMDVIRNIHITLNYALTLPANKGGAIKQEIREALEWVNCLPL